MRKILSAGNMKKNYNLLMDKALAQAKLALTKNEVPIGAIIVDAKGNILGRAYNKIEQTKNPAAHAEVLAIQKACKKIGDWRLNGCMIYVTLEPCLMCIGLIKLSRIEGVVFGAQSKLFGSGLTDSASCPSYTRNLKTISGIQKDKSVALLQAFFKQARKSRKEKK